MANAENGQLFDVTQRIWQRRQSLGEQLSVLSQHKHPITSGNSAMLLPAMFMCLQTCQLAKIIGQKLQRIVADVQNSRLRRLVNAVQRSDLISLQI